MREMCCLDQLERGDDKQTKQTGAPQNRVYAPLASVVAVERSLLLRTKRDKQA
jgi:hypothetical protein